MKSRSGIEITPSVALLFDYGYLLVAEPIQSVHNLINQPVGKRDLPVKFDGLPCILTAGAKRVAPAGGEGRGLLGTTPQWEWGYWTLPEASRIEIERVYLYHVGKTLSNSEEPTSCAGGWRLL